MGGDDSSSDERIEVDIFLRQTVIDSDEDKSRPSVYIHTSLAIVGGWIKRYIFIKMVVVCPPVKDKLPYVLQY